MVYCGKPSKGCSACRERKIRCDQGEPACGQCDKRGTICPGYRNMVDLMFRDESNHVIKKAINTITRPRTQSSKRSQRRSPTPSSNSKNTSPTPSPNFDPNSTQLQSTLLGLLPPMDASTPSSSSKRPSPPPRPTVQHPGRDQQRHDHSAQPAPRSRSSNFSSSYATVSPNIQERGTAFFFSRFVTDDTSCFPNYDFIYSIWEPPSSEKHFKLDCVSVSMAATGLAGLARLTQCPETMNHARHYYSLALQLTRAALQDPVAAIQDSTMLAILILGTYEFISGRSHHTMHAWKKHVDGASALAKIRGKDQFRTTAGSGMFTMLCHSVLISCMHSELPMPKVMTDMREEQARMCDLDGPIWRITDPIYRALQVRHDIRMGKICGLDAIIDALTQVEQEFVATVVNLPASWGYHTVQLSQAHSELLSGRCHIYPGQQQATAWNAMRTMRILVHEMMLEHLYLTLPSSYSFDAAVEQRRLQIATTIDMLKRLCAAVVASVPQHFGIVSSKNHTPVPQAKPAHPPCIQKQPYRIISTPVTTQKSPPQFKDTSRLSSSGASTGSDATGTADSDDDGSETKAERFMALAASSDTIILPLYTVGTSSFCTSEMRDYIIDTLNTIYEESGLEQARAVADLLRSNSKSTVWDNFPLETLPNIPEGMLPITV